MNVSNRKIVNLIISGILAVAFYIVIIRPIVATIKYRYRAVFYDYNHYLWVLNDSVKIEHIPFHDTGYVVTGMVRKSDQNYLYILEGRIFVEIFEYTELNNVKLNEVKFSFRRDFSSFENMWGTVLNEDIKKEAPVISVKDELPFQNTLKVGFIKNVPLKVIKDTANCKAYFGALNKMLLSNAENDPLVLFDFSRVSKTLIAFYTGRSKFLIIIITSDRKPLDASCINLLKLE